MNTFFLPTLWHELVYNQSRSPFPVITLRVSAAPAMRNGVRRANCKTRRKRLTGKPPRLHKSTRRQLVHPFRKLQRTPIRAQANKQIPIQTPNQMLSSTTTTTASSASSHPYRPASPRAGRTRLRPVLAMAGSDDPRAAPARSVAVVGAGVR